MARNKKRNKNEKNAKKKIDKKNGKYKQQTCRKKPSFEP